MTFVLKKVEKIQNSKIFIQICPNTRGSRLETLRQHY